MRCMQKQNARCASVQFKCAFGFLAYKVNQVWILSVFSRQTFSKFPDFFPFSQQFSMDQIYYLAYLQTKKEKETKGMWN